jgi:aspartate kinase
VAERFGVRVHVRPSVGKEMGTLVTAQGDIEGSGIRGLTQDTNLARISLRNVSRPAEAAGRILEALDAAEVEIRFIYVSAAPGRQADLAVLVPLDARETASAAVTGALAGVDFSVDCDVATLSIVGHGICAVPGVASQVMKSVAALGLEPEVVTSSGTSITLALPKSKVEEAARRLHADLGLGRPTRDEAP